jgi:hypothetical protein
MHDSVSQPKCDGRDNNACNNNDTNIDDLFIMDLSFLSFVPWQYEGRNEENELGRRQVLKVQ